MFYFVYVLRSKLDNSFYIGFTLNLKQRLADHNAGKNLSTRNKKPYELIYFEGYKDKLDALGREKFLKGGSGRKYLTKQMNNFLQGGDHP